MGNYLGRNRLKSLKSFSESKLKWITKNDLELLIFGFIRREFDTNLQYCIPLHIYYDIYNIILNEFQYYIKLFKHGILLQGNEKYIDNLKDIKSYSHSDPVSLTFITVSKNKDNLLNNKFKNIWVNYNGSNIDYISLNSFHHIIMCRGNFVKILHQQTYITHPWKLYINNKFLGCYIPLSIKKNKKLIRNNNNNNNNDTNNNNKIHKHYICYDNNNIQMIGKEMVKNKEIIYAWNYYA